MPQDLSKIENLTPAQAIDSLVKPEVDEFVRVVRLNSIPSNLTSSDGGYYGYRADGNFEPIGGNAAALGYKSYIALITQNNLGDPTVVVLKNDIGNIVWTRDSKGHYFGTLANAFPSNKTFGTIQLSNQAPDFSFHSCGRLDDNTFEIFTALANGTLVDSELVSSSLQIIVKN